jgi:acyl carrier protein
MTDGSGIESRLIQIIRTQLHVEDSKMITPDSSFVDDLGADSLDLVETIMAIETEFGVEVPDTEAEKMKTVRDALEYVRKHNKHSAKH